MTPATEKERIHQQTVPAVTATKPKHDHSFLAFFNPDPISLERGQTFEPSAVKMQAVATIVTAACCSPQNAINVDQLSNRASGSL
jgi:hypothetical protein